MNQDGTKLSRTSTYYSLLGLHPAASAIEIRRAYRELSKCYHPDTTDLPTGLATVKFQKLNEAYATLSNPQKRLTYDLKIGYSRFGVIQPPSDLNRPVNRNRYTSRSAYLDPTDRPLSAGEIFALFILGLTFLGCLLLVIAVGLTRGEAAFQTNIGQPDIILQRQVMNSNQSNIVNRFNN
ncbi:DnaJ-class molecular chaperone with C-terminal Zn finger domain [Rivularia sp. PCC 7116]|uniref:J domain-containing protein n=1 Tax=Rivularia sp. PCC 7116 TaxID=373994 RepID=UPI00029F20FA|nr:J domain-containing protein [Rivularia sp. PCC 7116]AFY53432.1 DnaJ-class molecular chaperone with C-terminal Zn finger domain [Rivularia sp. PCC 7116]